LATTYLEKHDIKNAFLYANQLLFYAKKFNERPFISEAYFILWKIYDQQHKFFFAYKYFVKYSNLNDSIESSNYKAKLAAWDAITKMDLAEANYQNQIQTTRGNGQLRNCRYEQAETNTAIYIYFFFYYYIIYDSCFCKKYKA
jgi:hypothetical protein